MMAPRLSTQSVNSEVVRVASCSEVRVTALLPRTLMSEHVMVARNQTSIEIVYNRIDWLFRMNIWWL